MTTLWTAFLPEVLPYAPHCPEVFAVNAIRNAAIEFCERSHWLVYENDPITGVANLAYYTLNPPNDMRVLRVINAWYDQFPLVGKSEQELRSMFLTDWRKQQGAPRYFTQLQDDEIMLVGTPTVTEAGALAVIASIQPTRVSVSTQDSLYDRWAETIAYGAKARLYAAPGQPFTNIKLAGEAQAMFRNGIGKATIERNRGLTPDAVKMRLPRQV